MNGELWVTARNFGAKCDWNGATSQSNSNVIFSTTGQLTSTTTFTDTHAHFDASTDVGGPLGSKWVVIQGVGPNGSTYGFWTQVASVIDSTHITISPAATITGTGLSWSYGHDDSLAFQDASDTAQALPLGTWPTVHVPAGICMAAVTGWEGTSWTGSNKASTAWICPPGKFCLSTNDPATYFQQGTDIEKITFLIDGTANASCATTVNTGSLTGTCHYTNLITGTQAG